MSTKPKVSGSDWLASTGQKLVGLTLTPAEHEALAHLAISGGLRSRAEAARRLVRWAIQLAAEPGGQKKLGKIFQNTIDSIESKE